MCGSLSVKQKVTSLQESPIIQVSIELWQKTHKVALCFMIRTGLSCECYTVDCTKYR